MLTGTPYIIADAMEPVFISIYQVMYIYAQFDQIMYTGKTQLPAVAVMSYSFTPFSSYVCALYILLICFNEFIHKPTKALTKGSKQSWQLFCMLHTA